MKTTNVLSYHNDPAIKTFHVAQAKHHLAADMLVAGIYGDHVDGTFYGCSIGCMAHDIDPNARYRSDEHKTVADHAGWPLWLVHLNDAIFEGLPDGARNTFHVQLREAIPVGVNLGPVLHQLAMRRMDRLIAGQQAYLGRHGAAIDAGTAQTIDAIRQVRKCHEAEIAGHDCDWAAAEKLADSAADAAEEALRSEAWSAARSAARWAARSAARWAEGAKWSVANTAADWLMALRSESWETTSRDLLELLSEATP
jgi:hypothetical protein